MRIVSSFLNICFREVFVSGQYVAKTGFNLPISEKQITGQNKQSNVFQDIAYRQQRIATLEKEKTNEVTPITDQVY